MRADRAAESLCEAANLPMEGRGTIWDSRGKGYHHMSMDPTVMAEILRWAAANPVEAKQTADEIEA